MLRVTTLIAITTLGFAAPEASPTPAMHSPNARWSDGFWAKAQGTSSAHRAIYCQSPLTTACVTSLRKSVQRLPAARRLQPRNFL
jgi:hypothetical protein